MLLRGTAIVSILTLLSRFLGFIRDLLVAQLLGASIFADAFFVAFRIPNLLRSFVAEGALTAAFSPVFSSALTSGVQAARETMRRVLGFLIVITSLLVLAMIIYAPTIVGVIAPGFQKEVGKFELCVQLTRIMAPYIACISVIAMINAALNALNIFGTSAWAQVIMNIVLIFGAVCAMPFDMPSAVTIISVSVLLGGIVQVASQLPACQRSGLSLLPSRRIFSKDVGEIVRLMIPATLGASVYQITIFLGTILASLLPSGSVSWLFYADRVAQFPIGIFSVALASVLLPALSNASAQSDQSGFSRNISNSLRFTSFFVIPMACGIWVLALPITQLLFERGAFDTTSSQRTAHALQALCFGLWSASCHSMLVRAFIARRDTLTPSLIGIAALIVNLCSSLILMGRVLPSYEGDRITMGLASLQGFLYQLIPLSIPLGHVGLALASSISAAVSLILVIFLFCRRIGGFPWLPFSLATARALVASLAMIGVIRAVSHLWTNPLSACVMGSLIGISTFLLTSYLLHSVELRDTFAAINRKLRKATTI
ncbi:MAG: murein biosynthesis integral membrane protein MurJ [Pseudomonadota bacterium]|jgi:putative peptidoglycan lipid II flippase